MFFDLKKSTNAVASPQGDSDIRAACCTAFADATCADWLMICPSGQSRVDTNSARGDGADGMTMSQSGYETHCCVPTPAPTYTCASFSALWTAAQLVGGGCAPETEFFDLKKSTVSVASMADADVKAACCTPFSEALCSDWNLMMCPVDKYKVGTNAAPGQGSDGMRLTATNFESICCRDALLCANFGLEASSAARVAASFVAAMGAILVVMRA